jgi:hypothetical protein
MTLKKLLVLAGIAMAATGLHAQTISLSPTKVFAAANTAVTFDVNYLAALAANQNKAGFTIRVRPEVAPGGNFAVPTGPTFGFTNIYATCLDVGSSPDYNGGTGNASVTWSPPVNEWPNLAACGSQTSTFRIATFTGTVSAFTAGKSAITVLGSPFGSGTVANFDVCEKRIVSSLAAGAAVTEGTAASYTITLDAATAAGCDFTVPITLSGTATTAPDTYATTATASCAAGVNTCTFTVGNGGVNDSLPNGSRTLTASIAANGFSGGTDSFVNLAARNSSATILDDEVSISVVATTAAASETGPTNGVLTFSRGGPTTATQQMTSLISATSTATYTTDYSLVTGTLAAGVPGCTMGAQSAASLTITIPIGSASCTVNVVPVNDTLVEGTETVIFAAPTALAPAISAGSVATISIADNDALPSVTITTAGSCAEALVPVNCTFTVTATSNTNPVDSSGAGPSVPFTIAGTATNTADYKLVSGASCAGAAFAGPIATTFGTPSVLTVCVVDDSIVESGGETVVINLTATPASYVLTTASASALIADDDFAVNAVAGLTGTAITATVAEGGVARFSVSCPTLPAQATFNYAITPALATGDVFAGGTATGTVTCPAAAASNVPIPTVINTINDLVIGNNRSYTMTLSSGGNKPSLLATVIGASAATVNVLDDDVPTVIPTMNAVGLGLMSLMLIGFAAFQRRRRQ